MVKINSLGHILKYRGILRANDAHFRSGNLMRKHVHIFIPERQYGHARVELCPYLSAYANITAPRYLHTADSAGKPFLDRRPIKNRPHRHFEYVIPRKSFTSPRRTTYSCPRFFVFFFCVCVCVCFFPSFRVPNTRHCQISAGGDFTHNFSRVSF